jgi:adenylate kinase
MQRIKICTFAKILLLFMQKGIKLVESEKKKNMLNIVLFGPPGAGKGTQSAMLIKKYQLIHLSTGDILRNEIASGTALGHEAKHKMDAGVLVPDEVVIGMIGARLDADKDAKGFIFDGFPRTAAQAEALDKLLQEKGTSITMMVALEVSDDELIKRLLLRGVESGRADDADENIIANRIHVYNTQTAPLKEYYNKQNKFHAVHGIGEVEEIFNSLSNTIETKHKV